MLRQRLLHYDCLETAYYPECTGYNFAIPAEAIINDIIVTGLNKMIKLRLMAVSLLVMLPPCVIEGDGK